MATRRELAAALERELAALGVTLKPSGAAVMIDQKISDVASQMGMRPASALRYFTVDGMRELAQNTARGLKEHEAAEEARPDLVITTDDAGLLVPVFALAARVGLLNGDRDVAADLCEVMAAIGLALRSSPPTVSTALLAQGVNWAGHVVEQLGAGTWTTDPAHPTTTDQDLMLAAHLRADLDAIEARLNRP